MEHRINDSYILFSQEGEELIIDDLFVCPSSRGNKLGYKLLTIALDYANDNDLTLSLYAEPQSEGLDSDDLIEYYRDFGFESDPDCNKLMTY